MAAVQNITDDSLSDDSKDKDEANFYFMALKEEVYKPSYKKDIEIIEIELLSIEENDTYGFSLMVSASEISSSTPSIPNPYFTKKKKVLKKMCIFETRKHIFEI